MRNSVVTRQLRHSKLWAHKESQPVFLTYLTHLSTLLSSVMRIFKEFRLWGLWNLTVSFSYKIKENCLLMFLKHEEVLWIIPFSPPYASYSSLYFLLEKISWSIFFYVKNWKIEFFFTYYVLFTIPPPPFLLQVPPHLPSYLYLPHFCLHNIRLSAYRALSWFGIDVGGFSLLEVVPSMSWWF